MLERGVRDWSTRHGASKGKKEHGLELSKWLCCPPNSKTQATLPEPKGEAERRGEELCTKTADTSRMHRSTQKVGRYQHTSGAEPRTFVVAMIRKVNVNSSLRHAKAFSPSWSGEMPP